MIPGKPFDPATQTSRRPTPENFAHLRKWISVDEKFIDITNITELVDVNVQLEQASKLFVSNVINRVIAQIIGKYGDGFLTIESTYDNRLKVSTDDKSQTILRASISESTAATHEIVAAVAGKIIRICNICLIVAGETNITLSSDANAMSGAMDLGGTDEPRGFVHSFGDAPLDTLSGEAFKIVSSGAVQISGYVTYYTK